MNGKMIENLESFIEEMIIKEEKACEIIYLGKLIKIEINSLDSLKNGRDRHSIEINLKNAE